MLVILISFASWIVVRWQSLKLVSFEVNGETRIGALLDGTIADLTAAYAKYLSDVEGYVDAEDRATRELPPDMLQVIRLGDPAIEAMKKAETHIREIGGSPRSPSGRKIVYGIAEVRILKPIPNIGPVHMVGLNYGVYAESLGTKPPEHFCSFVKLPHVIIGPEEPIIHPSISTNVTAEAELVVIIGKKAKRVSKSEALDYVFGYTVMNDVTDMEYMSKVPNCPAYYAIRAKNGDNFGPMGPCIVLKDSIRDPQNLDVRLRINGALVSEGNTSQMRYDIRSLIEIFSRYLTLNPGDAIATGSPGFRTIKPGDVVEAEVEGIGVLRNPVVAEG